MISLLQSATIKRSAAALAVSLMVGCATDRVSDHPIGAEGRNEAISPVSPSGASGSDEPSSQQTSPQKDVLTQMMRLAREGKIINCEFPVNTTVIDVVKEKWGEPDRTDWVPAAKGLYVTYEKRDVVFGVNKGSQIFEVRSFDDRLGRIPLSLVKEVFGTPAYHVRLNGQEIIGYTAGQEYKILLVFSQTADSGDDPFMDHYSVLYPRGTVNMMADDPGREW